MTENGYFNINNDNITTYFDYFDSYYGNITWNNGKDLANKLHSIISNITPLKYAGSPTNWETNSYADEYIEDNSKVRAIYTTTPISKSSTGAGSNKWQREHCFAATLLTGIGTTSAVTTPGRGTDFHNLYAASSRGNGARGNKSFGFANEMDYSYSPADGYISDRTNFEPDEYAKGKVARAVLYMGIMWEIQK